MEKRQFEKIRGVFDRSGVALTLSDMGQPDQPLVLANPQFFTMTGYSETEVVGRNCRFLQRDGENTEARAEIRQALATGRDLQVVLRNYRRDGQEISVLLFLHPIGVADGSPGHYLGSQFLLHAAAAPEAEAVSHVHALTHELTRIGAMTERLQLERRRHLAEAAAALVRAWERRR